MSKGVTGVFTSILIGAVIWFVLQVIIGVLWWVSVIAGGVVAVIGVLVAAGVLSARAARKPTGITDRCRARTEVGVVPPGWPRRSHVGATPRAPNTTRGNVPQALIHLALISAGCCSNHAARNH